MEPTRKTLNLPGLDLSYLEWGTGDPVVMLHGLADHGGVWQGLATVLADHYCCIAPDLRGHGLSSKPPETEYTAPDLAADLEALAQARGWQRVSVVAHSWAAKVALVWARAQPDRLKNLVLVDPFFVNQLPAWFRPTFPLLYRTLPFLKVMGPFPSYEAAEKVARSLKQYRGWSPFQETAFRAGMRQDETGQWRSQFEIAARNGVFADIVERPGLTSPLPLRTLLLLPRQGLNRFDWQLRPYQKNLPNLEIVQIPGNHWPHLVEPDALSCAVQAFLTKATS